MAKRNRPVDVLKEIRRAMRALRRAEQYMAREERKQRQRLGSVEVPRAPRSSYRTQAAADRARRAQLTQGE